MNKFDVKTDDFNKLSLPKRKLLDNIRPLLEIIDLSKLNQEFSKIEIRDENGEWTFSVFIVPKNERHPIIEISAGGCVCRLRIDDHSFYLDDGAPDEDLFSDKSIEKIYSILNRLLKGFTIIEYFNWKKRLKKKVFYYGIDKAKQKMETTFPTFISPFLITRSVRERKYIFI